MSRDKVQGVTALSLKAARQERNQVRSGDQPHKVALLRDRQGLLSAISQPLHQIGSRGAGLRSRHQMGQIGRRQAGSARPTSVSSSTRPR